MSKALRKLSELEGAILSEIEHRGQQTTFQVRRAFAASFSLEWKGSAGAIYPAVRRLERDGLLSASEPADGRKTRTLALTETGRQLLATWASDPMAASSVGVDPFRLRAGIWPQLRKAEQRRVLSEVERHIELQIADMEACLRTTDPVEAMRIDLALSVQKGRLHQIQAWKRNGMRGLGIPDG